MLETMKNGGGNKPSPQLTAELGGGQEMEDLEAQRIETAKRCVSQREKV